MDINMCCLFFRSKRMKIKSVGLVAILLSVVTLSSQAIELKAANESALTNLCMTALSGKRVAMHNAIKASGYSKNFIAKNLQCNGVNVLAYVEQYGKNSAVMLDVLHRSDANTSITDIAQNRLSEK